MLRLRSVTDSLCEYRKSVCVAAFHNYADVEAETAIHKLTESLTNESREAHSSLYRQPWTALEVVLSFRLRTGARDPCRTVRFIAQSSSLTLLRKLL